MVAGQHRRQRWLRSDHHRRDHDGYEMHRLNHQYTSSYYEETEFSESGPDISRVCQFPRYPSYQSCSPRLRRFIIFLSWLGVALAVATEILILVLTILLVNMNNTGFEVDSPDFPFYKNTRFRDCSTAALDPASCSAIEETVRNSPLRMGKVDEGYSIIFDRSFYNEVTKLEYDWCTYASCFGAYKVVPSLPRASTIGHTGFSIWTSLNTTLLVALWSYAKKNMDINKDRESCRANLKELGILDFISLAYAICGPMVWWWISFIQFTLDPVPNSTVSVFAWSTTWLMAVNIHYHPFSCILCSRPLLKRTLSWILPILVVLQWCGTVSIFVIGWDDALGDLPVYQGYNCVEDMFDKAPGTSQCSVDQICSNVHLLRNLAFNTNDRIFYVLAVMFFVISTLTALRSIVWPTYRMIRWPGQPESDVEDMTWSALFKRYDLAPILVPIVAGIITVIYCVLIAYPFLKTWNSLHREGPVVADLNCHAVNVGISPWRYYLDVSMYAQALRIVRNWFNA